MAENNDIMNGGTAKVDRNELHSLASSGGDTSTYDRSSEKENGKERGKKTSKRAFVRRKRPRSTVLAILFTVIKIFVVVAIVEFPGKPVQLLREPSQVFKFQPPQGFREVPERFPGQMFRCHAQDLAVVLQAQAL